MQPLVVADPLELRRELAVEALIPIEQESPLRDAKCCRKRPRVKVRFVDKRALRIIGGSASRSRQWTNTLLPTRLSFGVDLRQFDVRRAATFVAGCSGLRRSTESFRRSSATGLLACWGSE